MIQLTFLGKVIPPLRRTLADHAQTERVQRDPVPILAHGPDELSAESVSARRSSCGPRVGCNYPARWAVALELRSAVGSRSRARSLCVRARPGSTMACRWQLEGVEASRIAGLVFGNGRGRVAWLVGWGITLRPDGRFAPGCVGVTERMYRRIGLIGQVDDTSPDRALGRLHLCVHHRRRYFLATKMTVSSSEVAGRPV